MPRSGAALALMAALAGCTAVGGEQFSHVASPTSLTAWPHRPAELERFTTYRGPGIGDANRDAWQNYFLTAPLNRAFAASSTHFGVGFGAASADAAAETALRSCGRKTPASETSCALYAVNTEIVAPDEAYRLPFRGRALGPFTPSPEYLFYGPAVAKGVIVWSHGTGRSCVDNGARFAAPAIVTRANNAGWDVVRFDRDPCADDLPAALRRMPAGIAAATQAGYRKIVLAGQSRGAVQSVEILRDPAVAAQVSAVIAFSPAMSGDDVYASTLGPQRWLALASALTGPVAAMVFFFDRDPFNPMPRAEAAETRALWQTRLPNGHVYVEDDPAMVRTNGHGGAGSPAFATKYAGCILTMIDRDEAVGPCAAN